METLNINNLPQNVTINVDYSTAKACLALVELYLNQNDTECLVIDNNEPGCWNLVITDWREVENNKYD